MFLHTRVDIELFYNASSRSNYILEPISEISHYNLWDLSIAELIYDNHRAYLWDLALYGSRSLRFCSTLDSVSLYLRDLTINQCSADETNGDTKSLGYSP